MKPEKDGPGPLRADRWLHHVRIFKTRSLAAKACENGQVILEGQKVKPSRALRENQVLEVQRGDLRLRVRVVGFPANRIGAKWVPEFMENQTPEEWIQKAAELRREKQFQQPNPHEVALKPNKQQMRQLREFWGGEQ